MLLPEGPPLDNIGLQFSADNHPSPGENTFEKQIAYKRLAFADHLRGMRDDGSLITSSLDLRGYSIGEGFPSQTSLPSSAKQKVGRNL